MLFDLRGRGRRRTVRVIYIGLALLMGVGLVGFGVGGGFNGGGILNAASENGGSNGVSAADKIKKYEKQTRLKPTNVAAWQELTKALLNEAGQEGYVTSSGGYTSKGKELINRAAVAWEEYVKLNPPKPSGQLAQLAANYIYSPIGRDEPGKAVAAVQIAVAAQPNRFGLYRLLAEYAYRAKNVQVGDQAAAKAVELAPENERAEVKTGLEAIKKNPTGEESFTTTTNGKTYQVKPSGEGGTFTGTQVTTTAAPTTSTGSKTSTGTSTTKK